MSSTYVDGTTPLDAAHLNALQQKVEKGLASGYASLDGAGKVPVAQLPGAGTLPSPVVNGQWVKGVGGAAVWSAIAASDIAGYPSDVNKALRGDGSWQKSLMVKTGSFTDVAQVQFGTTGNITVPAAAHGGNGVLITLPSAWPTAHLLFIAQGWPGGTWAGYSGVISSHPNGLTQGEAQVENTGSQQLINFWWISLGY